ncbi:hypothetical protein [Urbifossiella limnaea]|uniref:Uncharacterized protein n=1 Tax=Urbifossiella limnaea TaxID=2528023 RepID=A0A517XNV3_9BACT|nr:hypothetical protein [Urbifossiella limnaea]QDU19178.1 hypothetical protein ETAA1_10820 [Urbifossiella limnaea]
MRRVAGALLVVACAAVVGCQWWPRADRPGPARAALPDAAPDGAYVESVLVERPVGDDVLDRELWTTAKPPMPAETDVILTENGLRVRVVSGNLPSSFRRLLETDGVDPHGFTFGARPDVVVPTATPPDPCSFRVLADLAGTRRDVTLKGARCGILVRPAWAGDGRLKVYCEPQLQHGERADVFRPNGDGTGLTVAGEVPTERYPGLGFEVTLGPDDHLIIGSPAAAAGTLGEAAFTAEADSGPRQRVLLIRGGWRGPPPTADAARSRRAVAAIAGADTR